MSKELLDQALYFEANRDMYNEDERRAIRASFKDALKKKCTQYSDELIKAIDRINLL